MSSVVRRHTPARPNPLTPEPLPLSGVEMGLVWLAVLVACVLAFHLVAIFSGGAW